MKFCCCATIDMLPLVSRSGFDRIALPGWYVASCSETELFEIRKELQAHALACNSLNAFCPAEIKLVGEGYNESALTHYAEKLAKNAASIGVKSVGIGSPSSRKLPDMFDRTLALRQWETSLRILADIFGTVGLDVLAEPLCTLECNWMNTTEELLPVIEHLALKNLGLVFDMYHAFVMNEPVSALRRALPYVREVHIAQYIDGQKHYLREDHANDCAPYFSVLLEDGYLGEIAVEATYDPIEEALPRSNTLLRRWAAGR